MHLKDYIEKHYSGNQAAFARAQGTTPQHVTKWINSGCIVFEGHLYGNPRPLKIKEEGA